MGIEAQWAVLNRITIAPQATLPLRSRVLACIYNTTIAGAIMAIGSLSMGVVLESSSINRNRRNYESRRFNSSAGSGTEIHGNENGSVSDLADYHGIRVWLSSRQQRELLSE